MQFSIEQVASALGVSRSVIDKRISRGDFSTVHQPAPGKSRLWEVIDVLRFAVGHAVSLTREGAAFAEVFTRHALDNYDPKVAGRLLLIFADPPLPLTAELEKGVDDGVISGSGWWTCATVDAEDLASWFASKKPSTGVIVIDLDAVLVPVKSKLAEML